MNLNSRPSATAPRTHCNLLLNAPMRFRTVLSHLSATSIRILDSIGGFSLMTPSHREMPSLMDCLVNVANGMPTRWWTRALWSIRALHSNAAALRNMSLISPIERKLLLNALLSRRANIASLFSPCPVCRTEPLDPSPSASSLTYTLTTISPYLLR